VKGRGQCEEQTDHRADDQREREDGPVDSRLGESRDLRRSDRDESLRSPDGCRRADDAGNDREHKAFHKQLSDDAGPAGTEGRADSHFVARPVAFASNSVATFAHAYEKDETDRTQQQIEHRARIAYGVVEQRNQGQRPCRCSIGDTLAPVVSRLTSSLHALPAE